MKIYLDTCSLQRPLDNKAQLRVALEAEAILGILSLCEAGTVELVSSDALYFEVERNPVVMRREYGLEVLAYAGNHVDLTDGVESRAQVFNELGIKPLDALHLASAEAASADYFCTCDDRFLKRAKNLEGLKLKVVSPLELVEELAK